jgi:hypothetical protein
MHLASPVIVHFLAMFARQGCDSERSLNGFVKMRLMRRARGWSVAKLKRARDTLVELLIRGTDEYAAYRGRGPQQQKS